MIINKDKKIKYVDGPTMIIERYKDYMFIGERLYYYTLSDYRINKSSAIIGYDYKDAIHYFETCNSLRTVPDEDIDNIIRKQIEELKEYLNSDIFKKFYKQHCK